MCDSLQFRHIISPVILPPREPKKNNEFKVAYLVARVLGVEIMDDKKYYKKHRKENKSKHTRTTCTTLHKILEAEVTIFVSCVFEIRKKLTTKSSQKYKNREHI
eukprot:GEMP01040128.1.p1 GENE.GEMP01040128.1~~GEMP01040128.1.p1  ORF type:complete len:104 (-),score=3.09 GEMP01040128.1:221-532(-)